MSKKRIPKPLRKAKRERRWQQQRPARMGEGIEACNPLIEELTRQQNLPKAKGRFASFGGWPGESQLGDIWFQIHPRVITANADELTVQSRAATSIEPKLIDHYFGIWDKSATPTDAEVKLGTGAILFAGAEKAMSDEVITHTWNDHGLTVNSAYSLHWYIEHDQAPLVNKRGSTVLVMIGNRPPEGVPIITGASWYVEDTVTCDASGVTDPDNPGGVVPTAYQWYYGAQRYVIPGATSQTYQLQHEYRNQTISVAIWYTDNEGVDEGPVYSAQYGPILPINYPATGQPIIIGKAEVGEQLIGDVGTLTDLNGFSPGQAGRAWRYSGSQDVFGSGSTYVVQPEDVGQQIEVGIQFIDGDGFQEPSEGGYIWSLPTAPVVDPDAPAGEYEYYQNFATANAPGWDYYRTGSSRTNDWYGVPVVSAADAELYPGARHVAGVWNNEGTTYGIQMEPEVRNVTTGDPTDAGTWAPTGVTLTMNQTIGDDLGGIIITDDGSLSNHFVHPLTDTATIGNNVNYVVSAHVKRDPVQRYLVLRVGAVNAGVAIDCWVFIDTYTWKLSLPNDEDNGNARMYYALCSPGKDGEYAHIVARLQNRSGSARNIRLSVGAAVGMTGSWDNPYLGQAGRVICTAYNFEVCDAPVITSPVAPGETRGQSYANLPIPTTPGTRVNDFVFQTIFRYPWAAGYSTVNDRIWYMTDTNNGETDNGIVIKETSARQLVVNLNSGGGVVAQALVDIAPLGFAEAIDIRGRKTAANGFEVWLLIDAGDEVDDEGNVIPREWQEHIVDTAEAKADLPIGIDNMQLGEDPAKSGGTAPVDMVIVRAGFGDYTEEEVKAWPTWQEPPPIVLTHPNDVEVSA